MRLYAALILAAVSLLSVIKSKKEFGNSIAYVVYVVFINALFDSFVFTLS